MFLLGIFVGVLRLHIPLTESEPYVLVHTDTDKRNFIPMEFINATMSQEEWGWVQSIRTNMGLCKSPNNNNNDENFSKTLFDETTIFGGDAKYKKIMNQKQNENEIKDFQSKFLRALLKLKEDLPLKLPLSSNIPKSILDKCFFLIFFNFFFFLKKF